MFDHFFCMICKIRRHYTNIDTCPRCASRSTCNYMIKFKNLIIQCHVSVPPPQIFVTVILRHQVSTLNTLAYQIVVISPFSGIFFRHTKQIYSKQENILQLMHLWFGEIQIEYHGSFFFLLKYYIQYVYLRDQIQYLSECSARIN